MARAAPLLPLLLFLLLAGGAVSPWARAEPPAPRPGPEEWKTSIKDGVRLAEELADYPVRHDVFHRCQRTLKAVRSTLLAAEAASGGPCPVSLREDLQRQEGELAALQEQVQEVIREFGKGLELSYEGAFSDFTARAGELGALLQAIREEAEGRRAKLAPSP